MISYVFTIVVVNAMIVNNYNYSILGSSIRTGI